VERRVEKIIEVVASRPEGVEDLEKVIRDNRKSFGMRA